MDFSSPSNTSSPLTRMPSYIPRHADGTGVCNMKTANVGRKRANNAISLINSPPRSGQSAELVKIFKRAQDNIHSQNEAKKYTYTKRAPSSRLPTLGSPKQQLGGQSKEESSTPLSKAAHSSPPASPHLENKSLILRPESSSKNRPSPLGHRLPPLTTPVAVKALDIDLDGHNEQISEFHDQMQHRKKHTNTAQEFVNSFDADNPGDWTDDDQFYISPPRHQPEIEEWLAGVFESDFVLSSEKTIEINGCAKDTEDSSDGHDPEIKNQYDSSDDSGAELMLAVGRRHDRKVEFKPSSRLTPESKTTGTANVEVRELTPEVQTFRKGKGKARKDKISRCPSFHDNDVILSSPLRNQQG